MRALLLGVWLPLAAWSQFAGRNTVSLGAGGGFPAGGYRTDSFSNSAAFSASYEFRLWKYLAADVAAVNLIPNELNFTKFASYTTRERVTLIAPGLRGIAPLAGGRAELFLGVGAAHLGSTSYELAQGYEAPNWLLQVEGGGRVALGRGHRFWAGPTVRLVRDTGRPTEEWVSLVGELGFRF